ncbi:hypothetical protein J2W25_003004 [Variovorax boronicumulans]|uniref:Type II toxin-antitoxin system PemK/MazF family toxin n=1 Tax=Variovorax boronicumulans TaxID=436515 RepID=A0AAW8DY70_9BURK|nr:hypothetical protein [Variovorax boronicumulans]MDP9878688.1 hypothetical protein [Variovorax boronicumulans]MDP9923972.1 hypothetical protein [Variovorax boronicumulans]
MRDRLLDSLRVVLQTSVEIAACQIASIPPKGDDVAVLDIGRNRTVVVTLLANIAPTGVVHQGVLAHHRMIAAKHSRKKCLLVIPELELHKPSILTPRVVITNMDAALLRASLEHMVHH